jgi:hypothetical protein
LPDARPCHWRRSKLEQRKKTLLLEQEIIQLERSTILQPTVVNGAENRMMTLDTKSPWLRRRAPTGNRRSFDDGHGRHSSEHFSVEYQHDNRRQDYHVTPTPQRHQILLMIGTATATRV